MFHDDEIDGPLPGRVRTFVLTLDSRTAGGGCAGGRARRRRRRRGRGRARRRPSRRCGPGVPSSNWRCWPCGWRWRPSTCDWFEVRRVNLLRGAVRTYAWGSRTAIAEFTGRPSPTAHPEAELWFGAHPGDPAWLETDAGEQSLLRGRARRPGGAAGRRRAEPFRRHAAVPDEGARGRRAAVAAGAPERRAGRRGLRARGPARHSGVLADPQLPRPQPQAGAAGGAADVRGARRFPAASRGPSS